MKQYTDKELDALWEQSCKANFDTYERIMTCVSLRRVIDILNDMRRIEGEHDDPEFCWNLLKSYVETYVDYYIEGLQK